MGDKDPVFSGLTIFLQRPGGKEGFGDHFMVIAGSKPECNKDWC
jgi:hypothetical protein